MPTNKSDIIKILCKNYPNFYQKYLKKIIDIFTKEVGNSLRRSERVELRDIFTLEPKLQKAKYARNPKTNEKIYVRNIQLILNCQKRGQKINEEA